jgi:periplasmic protein TonB
MRIDRYVHDERLTWSAACVLLAVTALHAGGIGRLLMARAQEIPTEAPRLFQVSLERLPPPPLPRLDEREQSPPPATDQIESPPRKTRPVPILVDTPTTDPVPPDTQVKQYEIGDELLEGEPGPPSPPGATLDGSGSAPAPEPLKNWKVTLVRVKAPVYPPKCLRMGTEGIVKVRVLVGEDGAPQEITLAKSSGDSALDESALTAVEDWLFVPAMRDGLPVRAWAVVPIEFKLTD